MAKVTISEALTWKKTLQERHAELVNLRNENSASTKRFYGVAGDKNEVKTPVYEVKKLDLLITQVARELRLVDNAIKKANAKLTVPGYDQNDSVLGEVA
jgi:hypothetical protein